MANEPDDKIPEQPPGKVTRIPSGRVSADEQDDEGFEAGTAVGKVRISLAVVREVLASNSVGPYLKYPIIAIAISILILTTCWGLQWVIQ